MKQELLEYIIRACVKEVLTQVNESEMDAKTYADTFKIPEKDLPFVQDLMSKHGLSYAEAVRDYLEMYGSNQKGKPIKFDDQPSHIGRRFKEEEEKGAPAPPADGQGTADQPPIPKADAADTSTEEPKQDEPEAPAPDVKGIFLVNPRDKAKRQKVPLRDGDDASLERNLHSVAAALAGSQVKIAISTMRMVKDAVRNPNASVYLYLGKYDPQSDEVFLMADKSLQVAKDSSVPPNEIASGPTYVSHIKNPTDQELARNMATGGRTVPVPVNENLKAKIKSMVNELLDSK